ncbi:bifunctional 4-hydroxy-2-oxoglutarate aldolase/2-dehydro-3-deoxy-phosphogluconate aldolase [Dokdonella immobilis]|uniref:2-dehydro-3-deoxy-phosphogluconate aldolase n=1 Tax=Dokdonella immobilis TaxID=578942 RepID=A0A1I4W9Y4_9GAMM|nr:bifunctional 4-hydroxy-2-oxoglutarate aldolase/2-dehydro-3-deoxy-phosphogluconate aldolase [Dokdonella immobilis]SFN10227.1 2-dehydro-3-deoxyphosphogluconate aldolase / (4S)-4-hydroxy-2-oxoglutarate aldolase [Dokdonella immobilis]
MTGWTPESRLARVDELLCAAPVLPVIAIERLDDAVPLARTLVEAGLPVLEITLRSEVAIAAIRAIVRDVPGAIVGAGTVLDAAALTAVAEAGAVFAIAPGSTEALYAAAASAPIPFLPAIATASELMRGLEHGHRRFKFFPAESSGGIGALKSFGGPFADVRFCPTGGIDAAKAPAYLALPNVITVGGSWMLPKAALDTRDWKTIGDLASASAILAKRP